MAGKKNSLRTDRAQEMFALIDRFKCSDLTQKAFCAGEGIAVNTFQYWLKRRRELAGAAETVRGKGFAPLSISATTAPVIEIDYPNGVQLRLGSADISLLRALILLKAGD